MGTYPGGVALTGYISPTSTLDTYATHKAKFGHGGYRSVLDINERDAIDETRREIGMMVYVISEDKEYRLIGGITNSHWEYEPNSAYEVAVANGYTGNVTQWLTSLTGLQGSSAYQLAVSYGYTGTEQDWVMKLNNTLSTTALMDLINTNSISDAEVLSLVNSKIGNYLPLTGGKMTGAITAIKETRSVMTTNNLDLATANLFTKTLTGATTFTISNKAVAGDVNSFILELTNGGAFTVTFWAGVKWAGGTVPTLTAAGTDVLGFYSHDGGTTWRGILMAKDSK